MGKVTHLIKLSVGSESIETVQAWQDMRRAQTPDGLPRHVTRMWPRREADVLNGGSIYWVIKGVIQCRQRILRLDEVMGQDGIRRCAMVLDPEIVRTTAAPRRPFQGWRYLSPDDAPADLSSDRAAEQALPPDLAGALADIGLL
ncbi:MAG: DUF1489 domain-containing protein [Rhodobacteraceae bacterium]|nr:DUF1489 domain-containing protein [Paracoccaceae bacterium]